MRNLKINFGKMISLRGVSLVLVSGLLVGGLTGCGKKAECDIRGNHAHLYTNDAGYVRYIDKEYLSYEGYTRSDEYIPIDQSEVDLYKFLDKKDLMKLDDNIDLVHTIQNSNQDYIEYRYKYFWLMPIPHYVSNGKSTSVFFTYIPMPAYSWTSDPNHGMLTGEQRRCHYVYQACKVEKDEEGNYVVLTSSYVDNLDELNGEYPYIHKVFAKVVDAEYGYDLDYEEPEADRDICDENGNVIEQSYSSSNEMNESPKKLTK